VIQSGNSLDDLKYSFGPMEKRARMKSAAGVGVLPPKPCQIGRRSIQHQAVLHCIDTDRRKHSRICEYRNHRMAQEYGSAG
jgi:hypothetical protein